MEQFRLTRTRAWRGHNLAPRNENKGRPAVLIGPYLIVPDVGLEPTRPSEQSILSAPRLPFRQSG